MPSVKHSPAPWSLTPTGWIVAKGGVILGRLARWPSGGVPHLDRDLVALADGKLIVRAPELLRMVGALRLVLDGASGYTPPKAQAAIQTVLDASGALLRDVTS